jgi:hypothetical protein
VDKYGGYDYFQYSRKTWEYWCKKNDCLFIPFEKPIEKDLNKFRINWQKAIFLFDELERMGIEYDQIALVDSSFMIKWDTPNFFDMTNGEFSAIVDHDNIGWVKQSIDGYKHFFGDVDLNWVDYFNSGFMVLSKKHKKIIKNMLKFWDDNSDELIYLQNNLKKGHDQTPINYMVKQMGFDINYLPKTFNLTHLNRKEILQDFVFIDCGYVWHFNGFDKSWRDQLMRETWNKIKENYAD